ncbi:MAG: hypothetical protein QW832_00095 [archaeon]
MVKISIDIPSNQAKYLKELAKSKGLNVKDYILSLLPKPQLNEAQVFDFFEYLRRIPKVEGIVLEPKGDTLMYIPDSWYFSLKDCAKALGKKPQTLKKELATLNGYYIPSKEEMKDALKLASMYSTQHFKTAKAFLKALFGMVIPDGVFLVKELDPLALRKACEKNLDKKVIALFRKS